MDAKIDMPEDTLEIRLVVENSLLTHSQGEIDRLQLEYDAEAALLHYLKQILHNSNYPIAADAGAGREIRLRYRLRSFGEPFFS